MTDSVRAEFIEFAHQLADAAGAVIRPYFRAAVAIDEKADDSPVTIADRDAEAAMRELIAKRFPDHGILGEEHGADRRDAEFVWVLDPIDGTKSFITGSPLFGTLVALTHNGRPVLGVIDQPITGERWLGVARQPTVLDGKPIGVRACAEIGRAVMFCYGVESFEGPRGAVFREIGSRVKLKRFSADCYAYGLLAAGFADLVIEDGMSPWDYCALTPVVEGAGGIITDWRGDPLGLDSGDTVLACGDRTLHGALLRLTGV